MVDFNISVVIDTSRAKKATQDVNRQLRSIGTTANKLKRTLDNSFKLNTTAATSALNNLNKTLQQTLVNSQRLNNNLRTTSNINTSGSVRNLSNLQRQIVETNSRLQLLSRPINTRVMIDDRESLQKINNLRNNLNNILNREINVSVNTERGLNNISRIQSGLNRARDKNLSVNVDTRTARRNVERLGNSFNDLKRDVLSLNSTFNRVLQIGAASVAIREISRLSDAFTSVGNRIAVVTNGTEQANAVFQELFEVSNNTRSSIEGTAQVYSRLALNSERLGLAQQEVIRLTKNLNQAIAISGASALEARGALVQFAQGFGAGELRGQELLSVLEQGPLIAQVIARQLGTTVDQLKVFAIQGKITSQVIIDAFRNADEELNQRFASTIPTIEQSFEVLRNQIIRVFGDINRSTGFFTGISRTILSVARNLEELITVAGIASSALASVFVFRGIRVLTGSIGRLLTPLRSIGSDSEDATGKIGLLNRSLLILGGTVGGVVGVFGNLGGVVLRIFGGIPGLIGAATFSLVKYSDQIKVSTGELITLSDLTEATFNSLVRLFDDLSEKATEVFGNISTVASNATKSIGLDFSGLTSDLNGNFEDTLVFGARLFDGLVNLAEVTFRDIATIFSRLPGIIEVAFKRVANGLPNILNGPINFLSRQLNRVTGIDLGQLETKVLFNVDDINAQAQSISNSFIQNATQAFRGPNSRNFENAVRSFFDTSSIINEAGQIALDRVNSEIIDQVNAGLARDSLSVSSPARSTGLDDSDAADRAKTFAQILRDLRQENVLLKLNNREREIRGELFGFQNQLNDTLSSSESSLLRGILETNRALEEQNIIREDILKPLEQENEILKLNSSEREKVQFLLDATNRLTRELTVAEREQLTVAFNANRALREQNTLREDVLKPLEEEARLLRLNNTEREIQAGLLDASNSLGRALTEQEENRVTTQLKLVQSLQDQRDILNDIEEPLERYNRGLAAAQTNLENGTINAEQFNRTVRGLRLAVLENATTLEEGFERGLLNIQADFENTADIAESVLTNAFSNATTALEEFFNTGKFGFSELVDSIAKDITRLAIQSQIIQPLTGFLGFGDNQASGVSGAQSFASGLAGLFGESSGGSNSGGFLSFLPGFNQGGSFDVNGNSGIDRNILSLNGLPVARVSRGETVDISPRTENQDQPSKEVNVTVNLNIAQPINPDQFRRSSGQISSTIGRQIRQATARNG